MSLEIFGDLPDLPKRIIVKALLSSSVGIEIADKQLPLGWLFSDPEENLETVSETYLETGPCLWVDTRVVEREDVKPRGNDHYSIFSGVLLASHWGLVNTVYLTSITFDSYGGLWEGPRPLTPQINKINFNDFRKYLNLCASSPIELDPFMIKEYKDTIYNLGVSWGED